MGHGEDGSKYFATRTLVLDGMIYGGISADTKFEISNSISLFSNFSNFKFWIRAHYGVTLAAEPNRR
jgi:hypothetical protein